MAVLILLIGDTIECDVGSTITIAADITYVVNGWSGEGNCDGTIVSDGGSEKAEEGFMSTNSYLVWRFKANKEGTGWASLKITTNVFGFGIKGEEKECKVNIKVIGEKEKKQTKDIDADATASEIYNYVKELIDSEGKEKVPEIIKNKYSFNGYLVKWMATMENQIKEFENEIKTGYAGGSKLNGIPIDKENVEILKAQYEEVLKLLKSINYDKNNNTDKTVVSDELVDGYKNIDNIVKSLMSKQDATARNETTFNDIFDDISYYTPGTQNVSTTVTNKASKVLTIITNVGIVLSVIMVAIMGIKYMLGSVEEKADYKKDMIPYLVGSCLLFGILTIVKILQQIGESINNI